MKTRKGVLSREAVVIGLFWGGFASAMALAMRGYRLGTPGNLLGQIRYALAYGGIRGLASCGAVVLAAMCLSIVGWGVVLRKERRFSIFGLLLAAFFSLNTLIYLSPTGELLNLCLLPGVEFGVMLLFWLQLLVQYGLLISCCAAWLQAPLPESCVAGTYSRKRRMWFAMVILVGWLPVLLLRFPGYLCWDSARQILQFQGEIPCEASHPLFLTVVFGSLFSLGQKLAGDVGGLAACMLLQTSLMVYALSLLCEEAAVRRGKSWVGWGCAAFFILTPVWTTLAPSIIKDSVHGPLFLLFVIHYSRVVRGANGKENRILLVLSLLCALTRKGGTWLIALSLLALAIYRVGVRKTILAGCVGVLAVELFIGQILCPVLNIEKPRERENYSFFYPIVGYYCREYAWELTQDEREIIDDVLDYETVCTAYSPTYVDPIKNTFHAENAQQVRRFLTLVGRFALRHPLTCLQAVVYSKNAYYTPFVIGSQLAYHYQDSTQAYPPLEGEVFPFVVPQARRIGLEYKLANLTEKFPWKQLTGAGSYTWMILILLLAACGKRDWQKTMELLPTLILTAGLLLTHVNGAVRYACPVMFSVPFLLAVFRERAEDRPDRAV